MTSRPSVVMIQAESAKSRSNQYTTGNRYAGNDNELDEGNKRDFAHVVCDLPEVKRQPDRSRPRRGC